MGKIAEGTAEWFSVRTGQITRHARALDCVFSARCSINSLITNWENRDTEVRAALHSAAVISYARPFCRNREITNKSVEYPIAHLKQVPGFDQPLHDHLLDLRHKMIAHQDSEYLSAKLVSNLIIANGVDRLVGVSLHVHSLYSVETGKFHACILRISTQ